MARRPSLIKRTKVKKPRVTKSEAYLVNLKYMGEEPNLKGEINESQLGKALNWYNTMVTVDECKEYTRDWLKTNKRDREAKLISKVPDAFFPTTVGSLTRLISRGCTLQLSNYAFIESKLQEAFTRIVETDKPEVVVEKISIQDRMRERAHDIIGEIEGMIDDTDYGTKSDFSLYDYLKSNEVPAMYMSRIVEKYIPWLGELIEALDGKDDQLKEAYGYMKKAQIKERILFFDRLIEDAEKYGNVAKKTRAPRKPRPVSLEKKLKSFKFQKENNEFKVASVNPEKVIGAQELWTFNTKYKTVTVFRALDRGGLQVKGTSIINYDEKTSSTRGTGRQTEKIVQTILNGGKITLRKLMDELKGNQSLQFRINENTILLKVVSL